MSTFIYSRVSTDVQTVNNQLTALLGLYQDATVITETVSGKAKHKPQLEKLLGMLQPGDRVVAYSLDRLGRSLKGIIATIESIIDKGATLELHRERATYDSAMGKLMIHILGAMAELERELISERTKTALKARKEAGVRLGPPTLVTKAQLAVIRSLDLEGASIDAMASETGLARSTVHRWRDKTRAGVA